MEPVRTNTFFPFYREGAQITLFDGDSIDAFPDITRMVKSALKYQNGNLEDSLNDIKSVLKTDEEKNFLRVTVIRYSKFRNFDTVTRFLREIRSNQLTCKRISFINTCVEDYIRGEVDGLQAHMKIRFLIDLGEPINQIDKKNQTVTPLQLCLGYSLISPVIGELLKSGGLVYIQPTEEQQNRVNEIMQPIVDQTNVILKTMLEIFEYNPVKNYFPSELKFIICLMATDLPICVVHRILSTKSFTLS